MLVITGFLGEVRKHSFMSKPFLGSCITFFSKPEPVMAKTSVHVGEKFVREININRHEQVGDYYCNNLSHSFLYITLHL